MCQHESKICPRCNRPFECKSGTITQCHCYAIQLPVAQREYIAERYSDCLCGDCLQYLAVEANFFRERYLRR